MVSNKSIECDQSTESEEDALDKWFLVLQPALENDYEQCEPQSAVVEMIFWVEEAVMFTLPKIQVPQPLGILVSQNFALKSWVSFLFSNCSELHCSRLLFGSLLTAAPPYLKLYFRVPLTCSLVYFLPTVDHIQFHPENL